MDRGKLPFRKTCEGYFLYENKFVIARDTRKGYIEFPGGGVDDGENSEEALIREDYEEAGVIVEDELKEIGVLRFLWREDWARTDKQKERYKKYNGEEMHFFIGKVKKVVDTKGNDIEEGWKGKKFMEIDEAIRFIESQRPFDESLREYREFQLMALKLSIPSNFLR